MSLNISPLVIVVALLNSLYGRMFWRGIGEVLRGHAAHLLSIAVFQI